PSRDLPSFPTRRSSDLADFVTAMMAFFIMLWILAVVEEEQLKGIAEYFQPTLTPQDFITGEGVLSGTTMGLEGVFNSSNAPMLTDRKSTRLNSSHVKIS